MLGTILYVSILLVNAMAVLSEDRFLARSTVLYHSEPQSLINLTVGWTSTRPPSNNPGFQAYDQTGLVQEVGIKTKIIDLISAVRTLLRSTCPLIFTRLIIS